MLGLSARFRNAARHYRGFTLFEVIVVLAVVSVIVAFMAPQLVGLIETDKVRTTEEEAKRIHRAIFGDPAKGEFGYFGDMGRLPVTLSELVVQGIQVGFHTADPPPPAVGVTEHVGRVGTGWRGPYLRSSFSDTDLFLDVWGRPFEYTDTGPTAGQIISRGPDGSLGSPTTNADNITFPAHAPLTTGTLFVSVLANRIPDALGATAKLYFPVNGEQTVTATKKHLPGDSTFDGFFLENVKHGLHILVVAHTGAIGDTTTCVTVTRTVPVTVHGGQQLSKEVRMITTADAKVTENPCTIPD